MNLLSAPLCNIPDPSGETRTTFLQSHVSCPRDGAGTLCGCQNICPLPDAWMHNFSDCICESEERLRSPSSGNSIEINPHGMDFARSASTENLIQ